MDCFNINGIIVACGSGNGSDDVPSQEVYESLSERPEEGVSETLKRREENLVDEQVVLEETLDIWEMVYQPAAYDLML